MKISSANKVAKTEVLFVFLPEKKFDKKLFGKLLSAKLAKEIETRKNDFSGKFEEMLQIFPGDSVAKKIFLVGLGKKSDPTETKRAAAQAIRKAKKAKQAKVSFLIPKGALVEDLALGAVLGNYTFKVGDTKDETVLKTLTIISAEKIDKKSLDQAVVLGESTNLTRDLVNLPANLINPVTLTARAKALTKGLRNPLKITVLDQKKIEKLKMGGVINVSKGSATGPRVIIFEYQGDKKSKEKIALVGKGVCFDSGGYNLKPTSGIRDMKMDMGGAATVMGIFNWIAKTKPKKNIIGVIGAVENMVSADAYRPGDIITMMNGQTCTITNTDAEGRLVLADCLHYTVTKLKATKIIDFATLTGACMVALGDHITGVMTNNEQFLGELKKSAKTVQEDIWELPITDFFREKIKDTEADIQNWTAGVNAGASMAGAFLENFVGETAWIHADIAGTAYNSTALNELRQRGATGAMVATVANYLSR